jgi:hypothetical protein
MTMTRTATSAVRLRFLADEGTRALSDGLADVSARANVLAGELGGIRGDSSGRAVVLASARARDLADALAPVGDLATEVANACGRTREPAGERAYALAADLVTMSARADALTDVIDQARDGTSGLTLAHGLAVGFARDLAVAVHRARELARLFPDDAAAATDPSKRRDAGGARRLVAVAGRLLPPADRPRYVEEFRAELWDLAEVGTGRWGQIAHAARLLTRAWGLRRELTAPHPRKASW